MTRCGRMLSRSTRCRSTRQGRPTAATDRPTLFESALQTLMGRPFGWLIVADPTDLLDAETAELRNQLTVLRRYEDEHARFEAGRAERRLAELDAFREAGLWNVRVLAGAATEQDLRLIAPVLVGSADLSAHPYRLRCPDGRAGICRRARDQTGRPGGFLDGAVRGHRGRACRADRIAPPGGPRRPRHAARLFRRHQRGRRRAVDRARQDPGRPGSARSGRCGFRWQR